MSYLKDREIWLSNVPTGNPPAGYFWKFIQNGKVVVRDSSGNNQIMVATSGSQAITGSLTVTGGITGTVSSASYVEYSNVANKPALVSGSAQVTYSGLTGIPSGIVSGSSQVTYSGLTGIPSGIVSGSAQVAALGFATTGSNTFQANQVITGSLFITQNLVVAGSSSIQYISSSVVDIADNIITVNAFNPGVRFGGLAVADSGSSPRVSGSLLFDSIKDQWVFVHENSTVITSSVLLMGPETYNDLGNESYISANRLPKGSGIEHLRDSNISDTGTVVSINSNTAVTGSLGVTGSLAVTGAGTFSSNVTATQFIVGSASTSADVSIRYKTDTGDFSTTNERNTHSFGIYDNQVSLYRLYINSSGNVGIGTPSPAEKLDVVGGGLAAGNGTIKTGITYSSLGLMGTFTNHDLGLLTNGSTKMTITSGGNVGIGTTAPAEKLTVYTGTNYAAAFNTTSIESTTTRISLGALTTSGGGTGGSVAIGCEHYHAGTSNSSLLFYTYGGSFAERMRISPIGNVGIGTTSPDAIFHVARASSGGVGGQVVIDNPASSALGNTVEISFLTDAGASGAGTRNARILAVNENAGNGAANMQFHTWDGSSSAERMRITSAGNVGIGTPSPTSIGAYRSLTLNGTDGSLIDLRFNANDNGRIYSSSDTAVGIESLSTTLPLVFKTQNGSGSTERMRITPGGHVGIKIAPNSGWGSAMTALQIGTGGVLDNWTGSNSSMSIGVNYYDNGSGSQLRLYTNSASKIGFNGNTISFSNAASSSAGSTITWAERMIISSSGTLYLNTDVNPLTNATPLLGIVAGAATDAVNIKHTQNGNNTLNIWQTGTSTFSALAFYKGDSQNIQGTISVSTSAVNYTSTSDYRLKENIVPIENGIDRLMQLKPSKFNWIETGNEAEGFIAHELQEIFPDAVTGEKDAVYSSTGNIKPQSVDYGRITPLLVKALQEQQTLIESLKSRIEILEQ